MTLPIELRKKIFEFAELSGEDLKVFICDCHLPDLKEKAREMHRRGSATLYPTQYRPHPPLARPLLRVSHQVRAEAKDIVYQYRTLIACSILCATDAFQLMPEEELNMTKTVLISRMLKKSRICFYSNEFKLQYMKYIRDELQASHFESAKLIRMEVEEEEEDIFAFEYEFQVGRSRKGRSQGAEGDDAGASEVNEFCLIGMNERMWRLQHTRKVMLAF